MTSPKARTEIAALADWMPECANVLRPTAPTMASKCLEAAATLRLTLKLMDEHEAVKAHWDDEDSDSVPFRIQKSWIEAQQAIADLFPDELRKEKNDDG